MPIDDGDYDPLSADEIFNRLETAFEQQFDSTIEAGDVVEKQLRAQAETLAENQEDALQQVYRSAYIQDATGRELEKLVNRIGLTRNEAVSATGVVEFVSDTPPTSNFTIPNGTTVQTDGSDPITYDTTEPKALTLIDSWEDGTINGWSGDTGSYSAVVDANKATDGDTVLEIAATADTELYYTTDEYDIGKTYVFDIYPNAGAQKAFRFTRQDANNYYEVRVDEANDNLELDIVENGTSQSSNSVNATIPSGEVTHIAVDHDTTGKLTARAYDTSLQSTEIATVELTDSEQRFRNGQVAFHSDDGSAKAFIDRLSIKATVANVEATDAGAAGNLTTGVVTSSASTLTGVDGITNPLPIGNSQYSDTSGESFVEGKNRETDQQLRDRAFESTEIGGAATVDAIAQAIRSIDHVDSLTMYQNKTATDNTPGGLPPHSFEAVVFYTGNNEDIAQAIFDTKAADSKSHGGAHGTATSDTVESDVLASSETIEWSAVVEDNVDISLTLIVDDSYIGDDALRERIVNYIGGTRPDGSTAGGLDVGEDLYLAVLRDIIVSPEDTGVWEVDSLSFSNTNSSTTTLANGADIYDTNDDEVLRTNGRDGSITITTNDK